MAWARIDDNFFNHPKVRNAGKDAVIFHLAALCHSNAFLTEGFIQDAMIELIGVQSFKKKPVQLAERLVDCGLWERVDGGYLIHDFLKYNHSKAEVEEIKSKKSASGKLGGRPALKANDKQTYKQTESETKANDKQTESHTQPSPSHTQPSQEKDKEAAAGGEKSEAVAAVSKAYESEIGIITAGTSERIKAAVEEYPADWITDAISEAVKYNARNWAYVSKVLARWKAQGRTNGNGKSPALAGADVEKYRKLYEQYKQSDTN